LVDLVALLSLLSEFALSILLESVSYAKTRAVREVAMLPEMGPSVYITP